MFVSKFKLLVTPYGKLYTPTSPAIHHLLLLFFLFFVFCICFHQLTILGCYPFLSLVNQYSIIIKKKQHDIKNGECNKNSYKRVQHICGITWYALQSWEPQKGGEWYGIKPSHPMKKRTSKPLTPSMKEGTIEKVVGVTFCREVWLFNIICFHLKN